MDGILARGRQTFTRTYRKFAAVLLPMAVVAGLTAPFQVVPVGWMMIVYIVSAMVFIWYAAPAVLSASMELWSS